jgi:DNA-binding IclR family transcriptional regulator
MQKKNQSSTIQRALDVLNLFKEHRKLSFAQMQRLLDFNKSTLFRVLSTLSANKYLVKDPLGHYELGISVFILGNRLSDEYMLKTSSAPYMKELADQIDLTVHLGILEDTNVIIIEKIDPRRYVKMVSRVGGSVPAHCTGLGKILLAFSSRKKVEKIINTKGLTRYTAHTITTTDELFRELETIRKRGFAVDDSEHEKKICCVAVPILDQKGDIAAGLSVTGTRIDLPDDEMIAQTEQKLKKTANKIRQKMGYISP